MIRIVLEDARTREKDLVVDQNQEGLEKIVLEELLSQENAPQVMDQHLMEMAAVLIVEKTHGVHRSQRRVLICIVLPDRIHQGQLEICLVLQHHRRQRQLLVCLVLKDHLCQRQLLACLFLPHHRTPQESRQLTKTSYSPSTYLILLNKTFRRKKNLKNI